MNQYQGECLCGSCRYVIRGEKPEAVYLCHCSRCRKETGSVHAVNVFFSNALLAWKSGKDNICHFRLENSRKQRAFCKTCGSPLPWQDGATALVLPAGTLDDDKFLEPTAHIFYGSRSSFEEKILNLKCFDSFPNIED